jgi:hypothetical protein
VVLTVDGDATAAGAREARRACRGVAWRHGRGEQGGSPTRGAASRARRRRGAANADPAARATRGAAARGSAAEAEAWGSGDISRGARAPQPSARRPQAESCGQGPPPLPRRRSAGWRASSASTSRSSRERPRRPDQPRRRKGREAGAQWRRCCAGSVQAPSRTQQVG